MNARLVASGQIEINGQRFDHDVVVDRGRIRKRKKGPSKVYRNRYGHTPISTDEAIPWSADRLVIGTGVSGQLPIMPEVVAEARRRGVALVAKPTAEVCELLAATDDRSIAAILHVTC